ncbi:MAG TPA: CBS domain-containing protein [Polyangiaceae bacterium]|nr:CBS domain-containing protein [Polyangiaceae bacterium]
MPVTVSEVMDPDFYYASQTDSIGHVLHDMSALGLGSAPVLDLDGHPLGMALLSEIDCCRRVEDLTEHLKHPVLSVHQDTDVVVAARKLAEHGADCLILVNDQGVAVGALRAEELQRAVRGLRTSHMHVEGVSRHSGTWSRGALLDLESLRHVPAAPGIILLDPGSPDGKPNIVWVEAALNIRERLDEMLRMPQTEPVLEALLDVFPRQLTFRALVVSDPDRRARLLRALLAVLKRPKRGSSHASKEH